MRKADKLAMHKTDRLHVHVSSRPQHMAKSSAASFRTSALEIVHANVSGDGPMAAGHDPMGPSPRARRRAPGLESLTSVRDAAATCRACPVAPVGATFEAAGADAARRAGSTIPGSGNFKGRGTGPGADAGSRSALAPVSASPSSAARRADRSAASSPSGTARCSKSCAEDNKERRGQLGKRAGDRLPSAHTHMSIQQNDTKEQGQSGKKGRPAAELSLSPVAYTQYPTLDCEQLDHQAAPAAAAARQGPASRSKDASTRVLRKDAQGPEAPLPAGPDTPGSSSRQARHMQLQDEERKRPAQTGDGCGSGLGSWATSTGQAGMHGARALAAVGKEASNSCHLSASAIATGSCMAGSQQLHEREEGQSLAERGAALATRTAAVADADTGSRADVKAGLPEPKPAGRLPSPLLRPKAHAVEPTLSSARKKHFCFQSPSSDEDARRRQEEGEGFLLHLTMVASPFAENAFPEVVPSSVPEEDSSGAEAVPKEDGSRVHQHARGSPVSRDKEQPPNEPGAASAEAAPDLMQEMGAEQSAASAAVAVSPTGVQDVPLPGRRPGNEAILVPRSIIQQETRGCSTDAELDCQNPYAAVKMVKGVRDRERAKEGEVIARDEQRQGLGDRGDQGDVVDDSDEAMGESIEEGSVRCNSVSNGGHSSQEDKSVLIRMAQLTQSPFQSPARERGRAGGGGKEDAGQASWEVKQRTDSGSASCDSLSLAASLFTDISHVSDEVAQADAHDAGCSAGSSRQHGAGRQSPVAPAAAADRSPPPAALLAPPASSALGPSARLQDRPATDGGRAGKSRWVHGRVLRYAPLAPSLRELRQQAEVRNAEYLACVRPGEEIRLPVPDVAYTGAFYSKPEDVPREAVKFAGRVFHVGSSHKTFLAEFVSAIPADDVNVDTMVAGPARGPTGLALPGPTAVYESGQAGSVVSCDGSGMHHLDRRRSFIARPLRQAPSRKAVVRWLRAQERKQVGGSAPCFETADLHIDSAGRLCFEPAKGGEGASDIDVTNNTPLGDGVSTSLPRSASRQHSEPGSKTRACDMIADLLDRRPPSPRYEESFLVAASFEPMSQRGNSWSQDSEYSAFAESPAKPVNMMPTSARMRKDASGSPAPAKTVPTPSSMPEPSAAASGGSGGANADGGATSRARTESTSQGQGVQGSGRGCGYQLTMLSLEAQCESRRPNKGLPALNPDPRFDAVVAICYVLQVAPLPFPPHLERRASDSDER